MRRVLLALVILVLAVAVVVRWRSVGPANLLSVNLRSEADAIDMSEPPIDWQSAPGFSFTWGDGSGWHGYDVVKIDSTGQASFTFADRAGGGLAWKQATFQLDAQTFADLKRLLKDVHYMSLAKAYHNTAIADGTQRFVKVEVAGRRKGVYCNNYFPAAIKKLKSFVDDRILAKQRAAIAAASDVTTTHRREPETFDGQ